MSFKKDEMLIMPAVDIKNGKCVQLVQGQPGSEMIAIENPENVAKHWEDLGAENLHIIDLDGTIDGKTSLDVIKKILKEVSVPIQLGGGIRSIDYAKRLLDLDIERLIIGTMGSAGVILPISAAATPTTSSFFIISFFFSGRAMIIMDPLEISLI